MCNAHAHQDLPHARGGHFFQGPDLPQAKSSLSEALNAFGGRRVAYRSAKYDAFGSGVRKAELHTVNDDVAFKLGKRADDVEEQTPHGRCRIDVLRVADEVDAQGTELTERGNKRSKRPGKSIVLPYQHTVEVPLPRISHQGVEFRRAPAPFGRIAGHVVHVFPVDLESAAAGELTKRAKLRLRILVGGGDARVNGDPKWPAHRGGRMCEFHFPMCTILQIRAQPNGVAYTADLQQFWKTVFEGFSAHHLSMKLTLAGKIRLKVSAHPWSQDERLT